MADGIFTFSAQFQELLPAYKDVTRVWIGNGIDTGTAGMLYAEYRDGHYTELGSVSLYRTAVENGYTGTEAQWLQMIMSVSDLVSGSEVTASYQVSDDGVNHPAEDSEWSLIPVFERGKFTWTKLDLKWIDGTHTPLYFPAYQGQNGQVESVNGETGDVILHGSMLPITSTSDQTIKEYIDENDDLDTATDDEIDAMFSMVFFSGAVFLSGRRFETGDSVTLGIEAVTSGAPMPDNTEVTIYPSRGNSSKFTFGDIFFDTGDLPTGQTIKTFEYHIREIRHTINGASFDDTVYTVSVTIEDKGNGTLKITKSDNFNSVYFVHTYSAMGRVVFQGNMQLNGRAMAAREFMVQIKEGNEIIADNISTLVGAASDEATAISFPPINYTLDDIGTHIYTVKATDVDKNGVTISKVVYTVTVLVKDEIRDGVLEIETNDTEKNLNFIHTYEATGSITFIGTKTISRRKYVNGDTVSMSITGNGKLPSPATISVPITIGEYSADFSFATISYTLTDMKNQLDQYDDVKTISYLVTETANLPGVAGDGKVHSIAVRITDDKKGHLIPEATYADGDKLNFGGVYSASGSIIINGIKTLENRNFVASDTMSVTINATNGGKLPYLTTFAVPLPVGQKTADFHFMELTYTLNETEEQQTRTFSYIVTESTIIAGATNDTRIHTVDIQVTDLYNGILEITPTYSDGNRIVFESIYDATGYLVIPGMKTLLNRKFKNADSLSVAISGNTDKLPSPANISVPLMTGENTANFEFGQIIYKITDLGANGAKTFNYIITETANMTGTTPDSSTDSVSVEVHDLFDGTLSVTPTYQQNNKVLFTNVYSATGNLSFNSRVVFTNGNMSAHPFTIKLTQVDGNNSTTQAVSNVVLATPVTRIADIGSTQDVDFLDVVTFVKNSSRDDTQTSYWFMLEEIVPTVDQNYINGNIKYDVIKKWINVSVSDDTNGNLIVTKTPAASGNIDATFTNEQLCDLTISKVWNGDDAKLTAAQKNSVVFSVVGPAGYSSSFTYADMTNGSKTLEHLTLGEYTVTESNNSFENFEITTTYKVGSTATNSVTLVDGTTKTITVTNNVNKLEASLTITKTWTGDHARLTSEQKNDVTFTVTGPKQKSSDATTFLETFTYEDMVNGSKTFEGLTLGIYTVTESNAEFENFIVTTSYSVGANASNNVALNDGDSATIAVTNSVNKLEGRLTISNVWTGDHSLLTSAQKNAFTYTVSGPKQSSSDSSSFNQVFTYADMINDAVTFEQLTLGEYIVVVSNNTIENYQITTTYSVNGNATNRTTIGDGESKTIIVTNNVNILEGTLTIVKAWAGDYNKLTPTQRNAISFTVTGPKQSSSDADVFSRTFTYADMTNNQMVLEHLTLGTYSVFETNTSVQDFDVTTSYSIDGSETNYAIITDGSNKVATVTNTYTQHVGSLQIVKQFDSTSDLSDSDLTSNQKSGIVFTVSDWNNNVVDTFTYADIESNGYKQIDNLPVGNYSVVETIASGKAVANYTLTTTYNPSTGTVAVSRTNTSSNPAEVYVTNHYEMDVGTVKVTKLFENIESLPETFQITNNYNGAVFTLNNADNTADGITTPFEWSITDVPAETVITFTESGETVAGYDLDPSVVKIKSCLAVVKDSVSTVNFVNRYIEQT